MKTALQDQALMCNLPIDCNIEEFKNILSSLGIKFEVKVKEPREVYPGIKGKDGKPLKMTKKYTEIIFSHSIWFIEIPYLAIDLSGIQNLKYTKIFTRFNENNLITRQDIAMDFSHDDDLSTDAYDIIEPFLSSSEWQIVKRQKTEGNFISHRTDEILLQNINNRLLVFCNKGRSIVFQPIEFLENYK